MNKLGVHKSSKCDRIIEKASDSDQQEKRAVFTKDKTELNQLLFCSIFRLSVIWEEVIIRPSENSRIKGRGYENQRNFVPHFSGK